VVLGNDFYEWCNSDEGHPFRFVCMGYILGATDEKDVNMMLSGNFIYCQPSMTNEQARKVVVKYMDLYPEHLNIGAMTIVHFAYKEYYPCSTQQLEELKKIHEETQKMIR